MGEVNRKEDKMKKAFIGIDIGSTGCKAIAIDEKWQPVGRESVRYDNTIACTGLGSYDQSAEILLDASFLCIRELVKKLSGKYEIEAIGCTGQMHGLVALDKNLKPLRPVISCVDFRNEKQNDAIYEKVGGKNGLLPYTNNKMVPSCTGGKILWMMENEPELYKRIHTVVNPKDYVRTVLTGKPVTDESDASGFGLYDVKHRCCSRELLEAIGVSERILPKVVCSCETVGKVLPEVASGLGLSSDTEVIAGAGDAIMQTVGSGAVSPGVYSVIVGSGGNIAMSLDSFAENKDAFLQMYAGIMDGQWVAYAGLMSVGTSINWFRENYYCTDSFAEMEQEAASVPPGCEELLFSPALLGQRNPVDDPFAKGIAAGFSLRHGRAHLYRALLEGLAFGMKDVYSLLQNMGHPMERIHISGGGAASPTLCQIFADVFQKPVWRIREFSEAGAYGAAILAGGRRKSREQLLEVLRTPAVEKVFEPDPSNGNIYRDMFAVYRKLYPSAREIFADLKDLEEKYGNTGQEEL